MFPFKLKTPLTVREWFLVIFLVVVGELIFLHFIYTNGRNEGMFNYFSFAATLISIILAVIAIIYGFIQSFSQQSATDRLLHGVASLDQVVSDIQESKNSLVEEIAKIGGTTDKIDAILGEVKTSRGEITRRLGELGESFKEAQPHPPVSSDKTAPAAKGEEYAEAFEQLSNATLLTAIAVYLARNRKISEQELFDNFLWPAYSATYEKPLKPTPTMQSFLEGWFFASMRMFNALTWAYIDNEQKTVRLHELWLREMPRLVTKKKLFGNELDIAYEKLKSLMKGSGKAEGPKAENAESGQS